METFRFPSFCLAALATLAATGWIAPASWAQETPPGEQQPAEDNAGRIEFDFPQAPPAMVEVDLGASMLTALTNVAHAAVQGVTETLRESGQQEPGGAVAQSSEQLQAVQQVLAAAGDVIRGVRVRVYGEMSDGAQGVVSDMTRHYQEKLDGTDWNRVVQVREDDSQVVLFALQQGPAIRGLFFLLAEDEEIVLVNVVCDLTPEKAKQLTSQATQIGLRMGLEDAIEDIMEDLPPGARGLAVQSDGPAPSPSDEVATSGDAGIH